MGTLIVVIFSLLVGAATYAATIRSGRRAPVAVGFDTSSTATARYDLPAVAEEQADLDPVEGEILDLDEAREPRVHGGVEAAGGEAAVAVGAPTLETGRTPEVPFVAEAMDPDYTYLRVATRGPSWRDRVAGVTGIIVLIAVSAGVLAFGVYQLGHLINATVERFLGN